MPPEKIAKKPKEGISAYSSPIVAKLNENRTMGRIIIFCRTYENVICIHHYFHTALGDHYPQPRGSPNYSYNRVVDIHTAHTLL